VTAAPLGAYAPDFDVVLDGQPVAAELRAAVTGVRFDEALEGADRVELQLANSGLGLLDHPLLDLGVPLRLSLGYRPGTLDEVFSGTITGVEPSFPSGGMPTLTVSAHDHTHRLMQGTKQRGFAWYLTDTVVAAIVAAENGLLAATDPVAAVVGGLGLLDQRARFQHKQSDYEFLRQLANQHGIDLWVDGDVLNFQLLRPGQPASDLELRWGSSLIDFTPRLTSIGLVAAVNLRLWVEGLKTQLTVSVDWDGQRLGVSVAVGIGGTTTGRSQATLELPDFPLDTPVDAIRWAVGELRRRINNQLTGQGSAVGDPRFRAGRVISLQGLGRRFSGGNFRLTSVAHSLDGSGYRTGFQVRQEVV
jgi:uncharacterized protein